MADIGTETEEERQYFEGLEQNADVDLRWARVLCMVAVARESTSYSLTDICARLHDAGYRLVDGGK